MEKKIRELIRGLSWKEKKEKQEHAIKFLSAIDEKYYDLIFDKAQKETWENAVIVIEKIGSPKNKKFFPVLIWLLQDINWPGAIRALDILTQSDKTVVGPMLENAIMQAYELNDTMWLGGLNMLANKANYCMNDFSNKKIYELLSNADF